MTIQDLALNPLSGGSGAPMLGYIPRAAEEALELDIYNFLIKPIRDKDIQEGNLFLRRFLQGPQAVWEETQQKVYAIKDIWSLTGCPDGMLQYLKNILGWTSELDNITSQLDVLTLRRLIGASVQLWKTRSNETSLENVLRIIFNQRLRIWNWFDFRFICDETELSEEREGRDPWIIYSPGAPEMAEYWSNIRIVDPGVDYRQLLVDIVKLMRPLCERYEISYLKFLDLFEQDGDDTQWQNYLFPCSPIVADGAIKLLTSDTLPNPIEAVVTIDDESDEWSNYMVTARMKGTKQSTFYGWGFGIAFYADPNTGNAYYVTLDISNNRLWLMKSVGLIGSPLGDFEFDSIHQTVLENVWYTIRVMIFNDPVDITKVHFQVYFDGVLVIEATDSSSAFKQGRVAIYHHVTCICECSEVEVMGLPAESDTVDINS